MTMGVAVYWRKQIIFSFLFLAKHTFAVDPAIVDFASKNPTKGFRRRQVQDTHNSNRALKTTKKKKSNRNEDTKKLRDAIKLKNLLSHLQTLDDIAKESDGNREAGTVGQDLSREYISNQLTQAGYDVQYQEFSIINWSLSESQSPTFSQSSPSKRDYPFVQEEGVTGFTVARYSGSNNLNNVRVQGVDLRRALQPEEDTNDSTSGCEADDFESFVVGRVALIQRGGCRDRTKVQNAIKAGASAVIIFNDGQMGRTGTYFSFLGGRKLEGLENLPVLTSSFDIGKELAETEDARVNINVDVVLTQGITANVLAETNYGSDDTTIVVGAHLDSVFFGPGINDDGSGSIAILETAIQMARLKIKPKNKIQFVWFSAEELGIFGSEHFVNEYLGQLESTENNKKEIVLMLNFDTISSPNGIRYIALGNNFPPGSEAAYKVIENFCIEEELPFDRNPHYPVCNTDYCYFYNNDIPCTAIASGPPSRIKTQEEVDKYGGVVNVPIDACYHTACDDIDNISKKYIDENSDIIAHTVMTLGLQKDLKKLLEEH